MPLCYNTHDSMQISHKERAKAMVVIREKLAILKKILRDQQVCPDKKYRLIKYAIKVPVAEGIVLNNLLTKEVVLVAEGDFEKSADRDELIKRRFLVPEDFDEKELYGQLKDVLSMAVRGKVSSGYTILTTTACNARCFYCYEAGRKTVTMSKETAQRAAEYIKENCVGNKVRLHWFGGEPLVNISAMDIICDYLAENGVEYKSIMTTNGYLFDLDTVKKAKEKWHLSFLQISIDGTAELYNKSKNYKNGDPNAYDRVMNNIETLLENGISVSIRLNVGHHNKDNLFELCDYIAERFGEYDNISVYAHQLFENEKIPLTKKLLEDKYVLHNDFIRLQEYIKSRGITKQGSTDSKFKVQHCMADSDGYEVILPDGHLTKCEHFSDSEFVGDIYNGIPDKSLVEAWKECLPEQPECTDCPVFPECIRLKKCPHQGVCTNFDRELKYEKFKNTTERIYESYMRGV